jgi:hypothetical protein
MTASPFDFRTSTPGDVDQTPDRVDAFVGSASTHPAASNVEYAVRVLGDLINAAFSDALRVDQLARKTVSAFRNLDHTQRIALGDSHPRLLEYLLLLEDTFERIDRR